MTDPHSFLDEMRGSGHPVSEWSNSPGVVHSAVVGPAGVRCAEAHVS